jgi:hypothetical protein
MPETFKVRVRGVRSQQICPSARAKHVSIDTQYRSMHQNSPGKPHRDINTTHAGRMFVCVRPSVQPTRNSRGVGKSGINTI